MLSFFLRGVWGGVWGLVRSVPGFSGLLLTSPPVVSLLAVPKRLFCFGSFVILDVARCYLWVFSLYINIKIVAEC